MDKIKQKLTFKPLTWMIAMMIIFTIGNAAGFVRAENGDGGNAGGNTDTVEQTDINVICQDEFQTFTDQKMKEFRTWMETHFQNKSSTTSLLTDGIAKYEELRQTLLIELAKYKPHQSAAQLTEMLEAPACRKIADTALAEAKRLLESKSRSTSAVKRSTALLDKYRAVNDKLSKLARDYLQMKAYLDTFAAKLPCYVKRSCNKG